MTFSMWDLGFGSWDFPWCWPWARRRGRASAWVQLHALRAGRRDLLFRDSAADEATQQKVQAFLAALKVGDRVVTSGGLYGTITRIGDASIQVQVANNVRVEMSRNADRRLPGPGARGTGESVVNKNLRWRLIVILAVIGLAVWSFYPPGEKINLGLDLKGGVHLVMRVQTDEALRIETETTVERLRDTLSRAGVQYTKLEVTSPTEFVSRACRTAGVPSGRGRRWTRSSAAPRAPAAAIPTRCGRISRRSCVRRR